MDSSQTRIESVVPALAGRVLTTWPPGKAYTFFFLFLASSQGLISKPHLKDPDPGTDWRQEKGTTEDEMAGWHHRLNGHEFEQTQGDGEGQGNLTCCSPWGCKESDMTEQMNNKQGMLDLSFPTGIEPASPALRGWVLTSELPKKSPTFSSHGTPQYSRTKEH